MIDQDNQVPAFNTAYTTALAQEPSVVSTPVLGKNDEVLDMGDNFSLDEFQVVRREFFAHLAEPSITFNSFKFYVNKACLNKFPYAEFVQVLVNKESKMLVLKPCQESARDSLQWCRISKGKREPKQTTCKMLCMKVANLMGWDLQHRYKLLGKLIHANGEYLLAFDLTSTEIYQRSTEEGSSSISRIASYSEDWKDQFGMPFYEHQKSMKISTFDGYAVYAIKEGGAKSVKQISAETEAME